MLLACDIGNTNIKACIFDKNTLKDFSIFADVNLFTAFLKKASFSSAAISSVVPAKTKFISDYLNSEYGIAPYVISRKSRFNLKINYDTPSTLGIDRICSAEGALAVFKNSEDFKRYNQDTYLISVDCGTATTINIVAYPGEFIGGVIIPGIKTMAGSLNKNTAQLPEIDLSDYKGIIGRDTNSSIASGIINSTIGATERVISYLKKDRNAKDIKIYVTGGNAEALVNFLDFEFVYEKSLVLLGIRSIYGINISAG